MNSDGEKQRSNSGGDRAPNGRFRAGNSFRFVPGDTRVNRTGRPHRPSYATISEGIDAQRASAFVWSEKLAGELGLDPAKVNVGELLIHSDKQRRSQGNAAFLGHDLDRREGRVPLGSGAFAVSPEFTDFIRQVAGLVAAHLAGPQLRRFQGDLEALIVREMDGDAIM